MTSSPANPAEPAPDKPITRVMVCLNESCLESGSDEVLEVFEGAELPDHIKISRSTCLGQCSSGPAVRIMPESVWYHRLSPDDAQRIIDQHLKGGEPVADKLHPRFHRQYNV